MIPLHDRNPRHGPSYLTWLFVALNVLVFLQQLRLGRSRAGFEFITEYAFVPGLFFAEPLTHLHTLVTSAFLHGSLSHLLSNMIFLLVFGDNVEDRLGKLRYALFYLGGAAAATLLHGLVNRDELVPMVGASGAVSAVLGAYIVFFPRQWVLTFIPPLFVPWLLLNFFAPVPRFFAPWLPAWLFIGYWALVQFWEAGFGLVTTASDVRDQVAWFAHVGGFVFGALMALWRGRGRGRGRALGRW
ncbi:MAG: rhomboid family intramembrane serine protease [Deinococcales bacterium]|nr:rhomboid family intramembrane serine protease [Deinococcales bacterium]